MKSKIMSLRLQAFEKYYAAFVRSASQEADKWNEIARIGLSDEKKKSLDLIFKNMLIRLEQLTLLDEYDFDLDVIYALAKEKVFRQQKSKDNLQKTAIFLAYPIGFLSSLILPLVFVSLSLIPVPFLLVSFIGPVIFGIMLCLKVGVGHSKAHEFENTIQTIENEAWVSSHAFHQFLQQQVAPVEQRSVGVETDILVQTAPEASAALVAPVENWTALWNPSPRDPAAQSTTAGFDPFNS